MKILIIHNIYSNRGGEEGVVEMQKNLFESHGHNVSTYFRDYNEQKKWFLGKVVAFVLSLWNFRAAREVAKIVDDAKIDVALIHNLFPIISPSVLSTLHRKGVKIIWVAHNFRLLCPTGLFYNRGKICERCTGGLRELNCALNRCEGSVLGSISYGLRGWSSRLFGSTRSKVDKYVVLTEFQKNKFIENGFDGNKIAVIGNCCTYPINKSWNIRNGKVLFVGRLSEEKGVSMLFEAARKLSNVQFVVAGGGELAESFGEVPTNVQLLGVLKKEELQSLYICSSLLLVTSQCYEGFPLTYGEAAMSLCPIIMPNLGGMSTIIDHKVNGLKYEPFNLSSLCENVTSLLSDNTLAESLAKKNQEICLQKYASQPYYSQFLELF